MIAAAQRLTLTQLPLGRITPASLSKDKQLLEPNLVQNAQYPKPGYQTQKRSNLLCCAAA